MELEEIHFHDSVLQRVIELPAVGELHLEVTYPVDWEANKFEPRTIVFHDVLNYRVDEGPFAGTPTLLDVYRRGNVGTRQRIELQTSAGTRSLEFSKVELRNTELTEI